MLKTHKFARKPFYVDAVRVSETNIEEVAKWCSGKVAEHETDGKFVSVEVYRPMNERQTQAFVGDWVLFAGSGFKVYTPKAFDKSFEKVKVLTKAQADEAGIKVPHEKSQPPTRAPKKRSGPVPTAPINPVLSQEVVGKITEAQGRVETEVPKPPSTCENCGVLHSHIIPCDRVLPPAASEPEKDEADKLIEEVLAQPLSNDQS